MHMIKVTRNESFPEYYEIFDDGSPVDEVQGRNKAKREAKKLAKRNGEKSIIFLGELIDVD